MKKRKQFSQLTVHYGQRWDKRWDQFVYQLRNELVWQIWSKLNDQLEEYE